MADGSLHLRKPIMRALAEGRRGEPAFRAALRRARAIELRAAADLLAASRGRRAERRAIRLRLDRLDRKARQLGANPAREAQT